MVSIENIFNFMDQEIAEATLQGNSAELRKIEKVAAYITRVAEETGDRAAAERSRRIATITGDALRRMQH